MGSVLTKSGQFICYKTGQFYLLLTKAHFAQDTGIDYKTGDSLTELFGLWKAYLAPVLDHRHDLVTSKPKNMDMPLLKKLAVLRGRQLTYLPESSFLTVRGADGPDSHYTLIRNSAHSNISELFSEDERRLPDEDTLTVTRGFIGAYPNAFYRVPDNRLGDFVNLIADLRSAQDYSTLAATFAVRRTDPDFWAYSDALHDAYRKAEPVEAALFDYNRFENR